MKIFKVKRTDLSGYDEYSDFVCFAESEEEARKIHPGEENTYFGDNYDPWKDSSTWIKKGQLDTLLLEVIYLGEAKEGSEKSVICASFHAG